ncbi:MAG: hypothetical protein KJ676_03180 [Alphaproteobacteria bacterium]|nr:hypothetical protein [Alphaproteobacteria bacterium]MBU1527210.1 hypothetical protein [Alphaproteobacteria bacterium]MBU2118470.1 hypothetical protein [Alphaproteobacteria bacterium]MBU2351154.1 hypothetical protein [Alphaproteobacteria bacterium]MBU2382347.1 hypothetical protein [Alphaproteobacteria bacterium]
MISAAVVSSAIAAAMQAEDLPHFFGLFAMFGIFFWISHRLLGRPGDR